MEVDSYFRYVIALIAVLGVIIALAALARHLGFGYASPRRIGGKRRLKVSEILPIDSKRRLLLVQRDDKEHLILVGPQGDTVVETDIENSARQNRAHEVIKVVSTRNQGDPA